MLFYRVSGTVIDAATVVYLAMLFPVYMSTRLAERRSMRQIGPHRR